LGRTHHCCGSTPHFGAFRSGARDLSSFVAGATKLIFVLLVLTHGGLFL
jgi:hypothetical protein